MFRISFRTDASLQIGSGHIMRCLTLADELRHRGADVTFVCREHPGNLIGLIEGKGYPVTHLPYPSDEYDAKSEGDIHDSRLGVSLEQDSADTIVAVGNMQPHWLIVDHYALDRSWEINMRPHVGKIMVIDDLANRQHECDLLLDQNYYRDLEQRYKGLVPEHCITLLGPMYVLLRPEFADARKQLRERDGKIRRILVFLGGSDPSNITGKILAVLKQLPFSDIAIDVVVGVSNPHKLVIQSLCSEMQNAHYHCQVTNMAELIRNADMAIGAGGVTTWERCVLGLPTLTLVFADNQLQTTLDLDAKGVIKYIGWADKTSATEIARSIEHFINNPLLLSNLSKQSLLVMKDWRGGQAVVTEMFRSQLNGKELQ